MNSCLVRVMYIEACIYLVDGGMPHAWVATLWPQTVARVNRLTGLLFFVKPFVQLNILACVFYGLIKSYSRDLGTWLFSNRDSIFFFRLILLGTLHCLYIFPYFKLQGACSHIVNRFSERSSILSIYFTANKSKKNRIALSTGTFRCLYSPANTYTNTLL